MQCWRYDTQQIALDAQIGQLCLSIYLHQNRFIAGRSLSVGVTIADQAKRKAKGFYKLIRGTRGEHRKQAAACLMHCATHPLGWKQAAAIGACSVILGEEYDSVIGSHNVTRLADRLKSN